MVKSCRRPEEIAEYSNSRKPKLPLTRLFSFSVVSARGSDLRVHFKNTVETASALRNMNLSDAKDYLKAVLEHRRCVPFTKFNGGVGRTAQAKEFKTSQGRWPEKSVKIMQKLLQNAEANAANKKIDTSDLYIWHIAVQRAVKGRRRTYRAHGRINRKIIAVTSPLTLLLSLHVQPLSCRNHSQTKENRCCSKTRSRWRSFYHQTLS